MGQAPLKSLGGLAQGDEENGAFARGVRGEEAGNLVIVKSQTGRSEALRIGSQIEPAANDSGLQLCGPVPAVPVSLEDRSQIGEEENRGAAIGGQLLLQAEV